MLTTDTVKHRALPHGFHSTRRMHSPSSGGSSWSDWLPGAGVISGDGWHVPNPGLPRLHRGGRHG
eukprot:2324789-Rhodomonas_salina.1